MKKKPMMGLLLSALCLLLFLTPALAEGLDHLIFETKLERIEATLLG